MACGQKLEKLRDINKGGNKRKGLKKNWKRQKRQREDDGLGRTFLRMRKEDY